MKGETRAKAKLEAKGETESKGETGSESIGETQAKRRNMGEVIDLDYFCLPVGRLNGGTDFASWQKMGIGLARAMQ